MSKINDYLSIGEMSKLTGASIKSLRYYETIGVLKPAYIQPSSGYRYYQINQATLIYLIQSCIEFDVPLKEITRFLDANGDFQYEGLLAYGKEIAAKKLEYILQKYEFISKAQERLAKMSVYENLEGAYEREMPKKLFLKLPITESAGVADVYKLLVEAYDKLDLPPTVFEWLEYGSFYQFQGASCQRFLFLELPADYPDDQPGTQVIPGGVYQCLQHGTDQIENARQLFPGAGEDFFAIETEIPTRVFDIGNPIRELRVLKEGKNHG
ncbi:MAG: MerR family DNA-binding transcriptional regulator [Turicibacter sp.]|nr:MerR family DNA-binding transcriptional regulator [Turicibacter sp.]